MGLLHKNAGRFSVGDQGAIAVEFGLIFPVILVMLLGIVEASAAISANLQVQGAARTGAHFGLVKPPVQGDMSPIISATRAALPAGWVSGNTDTAPQANRVCRI